jgi:hypothetical protein
MLPRAGGACGGGGAAGGPLRLRYAVGGGAPVTLAPALVAKLTDFGSASVREDTLRAPLKLVKGEVVDASRMSAKALRAFYERAFAAAKADGVLASLHLKATMMKISDPILFGHAVTVFFKDVWAKHGALLGELQVKPNNGLGDALAKLENFSHQRRVVVTAAFVEHSNVVKSSQHVVDPVDPALQSLVALVDDRAVFCANGPLLCRRIGELVRVEQALKRFERCIQKRRID